MREETRAILLPGVGTRPVGSRPTPTVPEFQDAPSRCSIRQVGPKRTSILRLAKVWETRFIALLYCTNIMCTYFEQR
jgi:hypothetical protein